MGSLDKRILPCCLTLSILSLSCSMRRKSRLALERSGREDVVKGTPSCFFKAKVTACMVEFVRARESGDCVSLSDVASYRLITPQEDTNI